MTAPPDFLSATEQIARLRGHARPAGLDVVVVRQDVGAFVALLTRRGDGSARGDVRVDAGGEVYFLRVEGGEHVDFAYSAEDQAELLEWIVAVAVSYFEGAVRAHPRLLRPWRRALHVHVGQEVVVFK